MAYHPYVVGSTKKTKSYSAFNTANPPEFKYIPLSKLTSMESQRETKVRWAEQRLEALGGLDMVAFGVLEVFEDPEGSDSYKIWNGNGRHTMGTMVDENMLVPCLVYKLPMDKACFYFQYTQDKGRRNMSAEALFQALHQSGDPVAKVIEKQLTKSKLYVKNDASFPIGNTTKNAHEVRIRGFKTAIELAKVKRPGDVCNDPSVFTAQAVDMISEGFHNELGYRNVINNDLLWALTLLLRVYPKLRSGKTNENFRQYLNSFGASAGTQKAFSSIWKSPKNVGTTGNSNIAKSLALDLLNNWMGNHHTKHYANNISAKDLKDLNI